jgi:hypothetical protein
MGRATVCELLILLSGPKPCTLKDKYPIFEEVPMKPLKGISLSFDVKYGLSRAQSRLCASSRNNHGSCQFYRLTSPHDFTNNVDLGFHGLQDFRLAQCKI